MRRSTLFIIVSIFVIVPLNTSYALVHDVWNLIVERGETITLSGYCRYGVSVVINGTVLLPETNGTLILEAPSIVIGSTGKIDGDGKGHLLGPGAGEDCSGGWGMYLELGAGGGYGGRGGDGISIDLDWSTEVLFGGNPYGVSWFPDVQMGSGGGRYYSGSLRSRGGGCIKLIASDTVVMRGILTVNGGSGDDEKHCPGGSGSGGGILISAPEVILNGLLSARGGGEESNFCKNRYALNGGGGGGGRIIICYERLFRNLWSTFDVAPGHHAYMEGDLIWGDRPERGTVEFIDMTEYPF